MGERAQLSKAFIFSVIGHVCLFLIIGGFSVISSCTDNTPEKVHVFTLVDAPLPPSPTPSPILDPNPTTAPTPVPPPPIEQETPPPPVQKPEPVEPKPEPTPPPPEPQPKPKPKPEPKPERVSYSEFIKDKPLPKPKPKPKQPAQQPRPPQPDPNLQSLKAELNALSREVISEVSGSPTPGSSSALQRYINDIRSRLNVLWSQPVNMPPGRWVAKVEFQVSASGVVSNVRFTARASNAAFDQSVINAMNAFKAVPPPPDGKAHLFEIPFVMNVDAT